jgi:hypothetical protein
MGSAHVFFNQHGFDAVELRVTESTDEVTLTATRAHGSHVNYHQRTIFLKNRREGIKNPQVY